MRYYPRFLGAIPHQEVDSYVLLSRSRLSGKPDRSTCMPKARRQRSSWARIKPSNSDEFKP